VQEGHSLERLDVQHAHRQTQEDADDPPRPAEWMQHTTPLFVVGSFGCAAEPLEF
jgi:hypothetical protein